MAKETVKRARPEVKRVASIWLDYDDDTNASAVMTDDSYRRVKLSEAELQAVRDGWADEVQS